MAYQVDVLSARLHLAPLVASDRDLVAKIFAARSTSEFLGVDFTIRSNFESMMNRRLAYAGTKGTGHWLIREKSGQAVGLAHLRDSWELPAGAPEIGWYLDVDYTGRGYATEATNALVQHGIQHLNMPAVWALIHVENHASRAVAERAGFVAVDQGLYYGALHTVFRFCGPNGRVLHGPGLGNARPGQSNCPSPRNTDGQPADR